jgi:tetratricopeptide (TPR) repeat protein
MSIDARRPSQEEVQASRLVAKANARMSRIENSVRDEPTSGYERNAYGNYFRPAALVEVFALLDQARRVHDLEGAPDYLRAGYLAWAGRLREAAEAYEAVLKSSPRYTAPALAQLARVYGLLGELALTHELIERHNTEIRARSPLLPLLTIEKLNLGGVS